MLMAFVFTTWLPGKCGLSLNHTAFHPTYEKSGEGTGEKLSLRIFMFEGKLAGAEGVEVLNNMIFELFLPFASQMYL